MVSLIPLGGALSTAESTHVPMIEAAAAFWATVGGMKRSATAKKGPNISSYLLGGGAGLQRPGLPGSYIFDCIGMGKTVKRRSRIAANRLRRLGECLRGSLPRSRIGSIIVRESHVPHSIGGLREVFSKFHMRSRPAAGNDCFRFASSGRSPSRVGRLNFMEARYRSGPEASTNGRPPRSITP